jgi:hypothetical protein
MGNTFNLKQLTLKRSKYIQSPPKNGVLQTHKSTEKFLKGPIPLKWLQKAGTLPGKAAQVGNALWYLAGLTKNKTVPLSNGLLSEFGVDRNAKYRALKLLSEAKLISVAQKNGQSPRITILECPE